MLMWPERVSLEQWAGYLAEVYPDESIPVLNNDKDWKEWAGIICSSGVFQEVGVLPPSSKDNKWDMWAKNLYILMIEQPNFGVK